MIFLFSLTNLTLLALAKIICALPLNPSSTVILLVLRNIALKHVIGKHISVNAVK
jgi:hypothetical protein